MHRRAETALRSLESPLRICRSCRRQLNAPIARRYAQVQATPSVSPDEAESPLYGSTNSVPVPSPGRQRDLEAEETSTNSSQMRNSKSSAIHIPFSQ